MGIANAQRSLDYIRIITEFISQPQYKDVVPMFGIVNEALIGTIGREVMTSLYVFIPSFSFQYRSMLAIFSVTSKRTV